MRVIEVITDCGHADTVQGIAEQHQLDDNNEDEISAFEMSFQFVSVLLSRCCQGSARPQLPLGFEQA